MPTDEERRMALVLGVPLPPEQPKKTVQPEKPAQETVTGDTQQRLQELETQQKQDKQIIEDTDIMVQMAESGIDTGEFKQQVYQDIANREKAIELVKSVRDAEISLQNAERASKLPDYDVDTEQLEKAKKDLEQAKSNVLSLTDPKLRPFVRFDKDGRYILDVDKALKSGISQQLLYKAGATNVNIQAAQDRIRKGEKIEYLTSEEAQTRRNLAAFEAQQFAKRNKKLPDGNWINKTDIQSLKSENKEAYNALLNGYKDLPGGIKAYNQYIDDNYLELIDGYIGRKQLEELKSNDIDTYNLLTKLGFKAVENRVNRQLNAINTIQKLAPDSITKEGVNLALALSQGVSATVLLDAGFKKSDIEEAEKTLPKSFTEQANETAQLVFGKEFDKLNPIQQAVVAEQTHNIYEFSPDTMPIAIRMAVSMTPVGGTIYFWDEMDPGQKALSVAGDVLFFTAPYILPPVLKQLGKVAKYIDTAPTVNKMVGKAELTASQLQKLSPELVKPYKAVRAAQAKYAETLLKQAQIEMELASAEKLAATLTQKVLSVGGKIPSKLAVIKTALYDKILQSLLKNKINPLKNDLKTLSIELADNTKILKNNYNNWQMVSKAETRLDDIVNYTKSIVDDLLDKGDTVKKVGRLQKQLTSLTSEYNKVKNKYPTSPDRWADLSQEIVEIETKIKALKLGDAVALQQQYITIKDTIDTLDKLLKEMPQNSLYRAAVIEALKEARLKATTLPKQIDDIIKNLEIEWEKPKDFTMSGTGKGAINTKVDPRIAKLFGGGGTSKTELQTLANRATRSQLERLTGVTPEITIKSKAVTGKKVKYSEITKISPASVPKPVSGISPESEALTETQLNAMPSISVYALQDIKTKQETQPATETQPDTKIDESLKVKTTTKVSPITATTQLTKLKKLKGLILPAGVSDDDIKRIKKNKLPIVWRQGFGWWIIKYPWKSAKDMYFERKKPPGAFEVKGVGSAYRTLQALGGNPNVLIRRDLGIVDVTVTGTKLTFKRKPAKKNKKSKATEIIKRR